MNSLFQASAILRGIKHTSLSSAGVGGERDHGLGWTHYIQDEDIIIFISLGIIATTSLRFLPKGKGQHISGPRDGNQCGLGS